MMIATRASMMSMRFNICALLTPDDCLTTRRATEKTKQEPAVRDDNVQFRATRLFGLGPEKVNQTYRLNCLPKDSKKLSVQLLNLVNGRLDLLPLFRSR